MIRGPEISGLLKGGLASPNNREEDARHLYIWSSLHCVRPQARCYATFMAGDRNDFFPMDVIRNLVCRAMRPRIVPCRFAEGNVTQNRSIK